MQGEVDRAVRGVIQLKQPRSHPPRDDANGTKIIRLVKMALPKRGERRVHHAPRRDENIVIGHEIAA